MGRGGSDWQYCGALWLFHGKRGLTGYALQCLVIDSGGRSVMRHSFCVSGVSLVCGCPARGPPVSRFALPLLESGSHTSSGQVFLLLASVADNGSTWQGYLPSHLSSSPPLAGSGSRMQLWPAALDPSWKLPNLRFEASSVPLAPEGTTPVYWSDQTAPWAPLSTRCNLPRPLWDPLKCSYCSFDQSYPQP